MIARVRSVTWLTVLDRRELGGEIYLEGSDSAGKGEAELGEGPEQHLSSRHSWLAQKGTRGCQPPTSSLEPFPLASLSLSASTCRGPCSSRPGASSTGHC